MNGPRPDRAIILAPHGRDALIASTMLVEAGLPAEPAGDLEEFVAMLAAGAGFALVTEEALRGADLRGIAALIEGQPEWSDLPFILLTERGGGLERNPAASRYQTVLGNVTFLERPFHPTTLISLARAAGRARQRQYDARARLEIIREGQERLRVAMSAGDLGAWRVSYPELKLESSPECKSHYGRGAEEPFSYRDWVDDIHPDDLPRVREAVSESFRLGRDYRVQYRCHWPNGSLHWAEVGGRPTLDSWGGRLAMTGVSLDITARKAAEAAQTRFTEELERQVEERTRERSAALQQLHEAQKLETLGQLTGGVAHDFNNLLTPIIGGLDLLQRAHSDSRSQRLIGGALQASERARTLVARLLAFARRQTLTTRPVDLATLVEGVLDLIRRSIGPQIEVQFDAAPDLPPALADPGQLELALLNLAVNARDAMPGGGRLTISVSHAEPDPQLPAGQYLRIAVADTGSGMDDATLKRAIEPFYSTKGPGKGTGLGLSMVHGLAAQSGGALRLSSTPGTGTTAILLLPATSGAVAEAADESIEALPQGGQLEVLLVDDEEVVRDGTAAMLGELGHRVTQADSGSAALALLHSQHFDLVVTDYLMPGMNGVEVADAVARLASPPPVLLVTGFADLAEDDARRLPRLAKPFRPAALAAAIAPLVTGA